MGPVTALATEVFLGDPGRFADGKALASYVGMIPREYSSGERQRFGALTKQGNPLLRFLWGEAGAHAARRDPELQRFYRRKLIGSLTSARLCENRTIKGGYFNVYERKLGSSCALRGARHTFFARGWKETGDRQ